MMKKKIRTAILVLPLLIAAGMMYMFEHTISYYNERYVDLLYGEKKTEISALINKLSEQAGSFDTFDENIADDLLLAIMREFDKTPGVYARIVRKDFTPVLPDTETNFFMVFDRKSNIDYEATCNELALRDMGETYTRPNGIRVKIYWEYYPKGDMRYYVVMGVIPDVLYRIININHLSVYFFVMTAVMLAAMYGALYAQNRTKTGIYKE